jgi:hypothetical protein
MFLNIMTISHLKIEIAPLVPYIKDTVSKGHWLNVFCTVYTYVYVFCSTEIVKFANTRSTKGVILVVRIIKVCAQT